MTLSARNQLPGTVKSVVLGTVMAEVVLDVAGHQVVSVITRHAVENLDVKAGDQVKAVINSTEVKIEKRRAFGGGGTLAAPDCHSPAAASRRPPEKAGVA